MKAFGLLLRLFSYLFELILSLFLTGIALAAGSTSLQLGMLPWTGAMLNRWVLGLGVLGILVTLLAVVGRFRFLYPLWCLAVLVLMVRGFFVSGYSFAGPDEWRMALWLTAGAFVAFLGGLTVFSGKRKKKAA